MVLASKRSRAEPRRLARLRLVLLKPETQPRFHFHMSEPVLPVKVFVRWASDDLVFSHPPDNSGDGLSEIWKRMYIPVGPVHMIESMVARRREPGHV